MSDKPTKKSRKTSGKKRNKKVDKKKTASQPPVQDSAKSKGKVLDEIIGMPYFISTYKETRNMLTNSTLVIRITPGKPHMEKGFTLYSIQSRWKEYLGRLSKLGYTFEGKNNFLKVAVLADSMPTESFGNDYGESFLESIASGVSSVAGEITQISGSKTATEGIKKLNDLLKGSGGLSGKLGQKFEELGGSISDKVEKAGKGSAAKESLQRLGQIANKLLGGQRIDFPMIWRNSTYSPNYGFTVRLYNPKPSSTEYTNKYIVGPLAALLTLAIPDSDSSLGTYSFPFSCKVDCPGLFTLPAAAITNISINKAIEGQLGFNNIIGMVDVRIEFISLFGTLVGGGSAGSDRPTLAQYIKNMEKSRTIQKIYFANLLNKKKQTPEIKIPAPPVTIASSSSSEPVDRVNSEKKSSEETIVANFPPGWQTSGM